MGIPDAGIYIDPDDVLQRTQTESPYVIRFDMDRDELNLSDTADEVTVSWCVRVDLLEEIDEEWFEEANNGQKHFSVSYTKTFITVTFKLDGSFELDAIDIDENTDDAINDFRIEKDYGVVSYQCELEPPHNPTNELITQKQDHLGICVDTIEEGIYLNKVDNFELDMPSLSSQLPGYVPVNNPRIIDGVVRFLSTFDCTLRKNPDAPLNTKCFIETIVETPFFDTWNLESNDYYLRAIGAVDLRVDDPNTQRRRIKANIGVPRNLQKLQQKEGPIDVITSLGYEEDDFSIFSGYEVSSTFCNVIVISCVFSFLL